MPVCIENRAPAHRRRTRPPSRSPLNRPAHVSDTDWTEYQRCQAEHDDLMTQVADREAQIEFGFIDSHDDYECTWDYTPSTPVHPSSATSGRLPAAVSHPAPTAPQQPRRR